MCDVRIQFDQVWFSMEHRKHLGMEFGDLKAQFSPVSKFHD